MGGLSVTCEREIEFLDTNRKIGRVIGCFSGKHDRVVVSGLGFVCIVDSKTGEVEKTIEVEQEHDKVGISCVALGTYLVISESHGQNRILFYDSLRNFEVVKRIRMYVSQTFSIFRHILYCYNGRLIKGPVYRFDTSKLDDIKENNNDIDPFVMKDESVFCVLQIPKVEGENNDLLLLCGGRGSVLISNADTGETIDHLNTTHTNSISMISYYRESGKIRLITVSHSDETIMLMDLKGSIFHKFDFYEKAKSSIFTSEDQPTNILKITNQDFIVGTEKGKLMHLQPLKKSLYSMGNGYKKRQITKMSWVTYSSDELRFCYDSWGTGAIFKVNGLKLKKNKDLMKDVQFSRNSLICWKKWKMLDEDIEERMNFLKDWLREVELFVVVFREGRVGGGNSRIMCTKSFLD